MGKKPPKRCCAILVGRPNKGDTVRRCGQIAAGRSDYCVVHRQHARYYNDLRAAFGPGWEERVPGASDGLTPRKGWKGYTEDATVETPLPRPASASDDQPAPPTQPAPKPKPPTAWERAQQASLARLRGETP